MIGILMAAMKRTCSVPTNKIDLEDRRPILRNTIFYLFAILFCFSEAPRMVAQGAPISPLPAQRIAHLRHGINLSEWFAQVYDQRGYTKEHFQAWTSDADIALIAQLGFDHVRLSVNPQPMFHKGHADELPPDYVSYLDDAVQMILKHGLAVIIDLHPDGDFKAKLAHDDFVEEFADFWRALARHYASQDPNLVFFEILNEPEMSDRYRWYGVQSKLVTAVREGAPQHTIIAAGGRWDDDEDMIFLEPSRDSNIIYNFHFYFPHVFTHQSATWGVNYWHFERGLAYPSDEANAAKVAENIPDAANRLQVIRYGLDHWGPARINAEIDFVAAWAKERGLTITCNEFGVYRKAANPDDRARWITDVRTALEKNGIGWTMWDYSGGFGVVVKKDGKANVDPLTVKALGLKVP
jgi:aryl-phospho-beta-D-glucosidase BglC (GH1 family)